MAQGFDGQGQDFRAPVELRQTGEQVLVCPSLKMKQQVQNDQGLSQREFGDRLGVSRQTVAAIESGKHAPSLALAFRIAALFELTLEKIFELKKATR